MRASSGNRFSFGTRMLILRAHVFRGLMGLAVALAATSAALASIQVTYDIVPTFATDGFSASWLHGATGGPPRGSPENGALLNGPTSSRITGTLAGDLSGNILSNASGSVSGKLKHFSNHLNDTLGTNYTTYTPFELKLGGAANGGAGALAFETDGAGTGQFTGGYLDFSLFVGGSATSLLDGTFFFKPQAESGSATLSPNRGTSSDFTLWGWNWMHDGAPVDGGDEPVWSSFLSGLGYTGDTVMRSQLDSPLGIAMYVVDADAPAPEGLQSPEPATFVVWGLIALASAGAYRLRIRFGA